MEKGTEIRQGERQGQGDPEVTVLNPSDLFGKVKTCFSQKRYGCVMERLNMRTNEKSRRTADDGMGTEGTPRPNVV